MSKSRGMGALHVIVTREWLAAFKAKCRDANVTMRDVVIAACDAYQPKSRAELEAEVAELKRRLNNAPHDAAEGAGE